MKTKIHESADKIMYLFSCGNETKEVTYHKCCFVFAEGQEIDFEEISDNDYQNWANSVIETSEPVT